MNRRAYAFVRGAWAPLEIRPPRREPGLLLQLNFYTVWLQGRNAQPTKNVGKMKAFFLERPALTCPRRRVMKLVRTTLLSVAGVILALGLTAAQAQTAGSDVSPGGPVTPEVGGGGPG